MSQQGVRWQSSLAAAVALACLVGCGGSSPSTPVDGGGGKDGGGAVDATGSGGGGGHGTGGSVADGGDAAGGTGTGGGNAGSGGTGNNDSGMTADADGGSTMADADGGGPGGNDAAGSETSGGDTNSNDGGTTEGGSTGGFHPPASDLMFDVSTDVDPVAPGGRVRYTVRVGNISTHAVDAVAVSLLLPTGLAFNGPNDSEPNGTGCSFGNCAANSQANWALGTIGAGLSRTISINVQVLQTVDSGTSIATSFKLSATNFNTVSFSKTIQVRSSSASQLATGTETYPLTPGQRFTFDIDFGQLGMAALSGTTLQATFAPGLSVASISDGGTQASNDAPVRWTIGSVGVGATLHRQVDLTVDANVVAGALLTTRTTLMYDGGLDVDAAAEYTLGVVATPPIAALTVAASPSPAVPGQRHAFRVTVSNLGTRAVDGYTLQVLVPTGLSFNGVNDADPNGTGCSFANCAANTWSTWAIGTLAAGAAASVDMNANVVADLAGNGNVIRTLFTLNATGIPEIEAVKTVQIFDEPAAELALTATANPITNAQAFTYNLDIGQIGAAALSTTQLRAHLPQGLTVGTISDGGAKDATTGDIVWNIGGVAVGATLRRTVAVTGEGSAAPGTILRATASLTHDGGAPVDNVVGYDIPVISAAQPVTITVSANANPAIPGNHDLYTATITNTSARAISGVSLFLRVPVGLSFNGVNDADPDGTGCSFANCVAGSETTWALGALAANASQMITVNPLVLSTLLSGSLIHTPFWLSFTDQTAPTFVDLVLPTHQ